MAQSVVVLQRVPLSPVPGVLAPFCQVSVGPRQHHAATDGPWDTVGHHGTPWDTVGHRGTPWDTDPRGVVGCGCPFEKVRVLATGQVVNMVLGVAFSHGVSSCIFTTRKLDHVAMVDLGPRTHGEDGLKTRERSKEERQKEREEKRKNKVISCVASAVSGAVYEFMVDLLLHIATMVDILVCIL